MPELVPPVLLGFQERGIIQRAPIGYGIPGQGLTVYSVVGWLVVGWYMFLLRILSVLCLRESVCWPYKYSTANSDLAK